MKKNVKVCVSVFVQKARPAGIPLFTSGRTKPFLIECKCVNKVSRYFCTSCRVIDHKDADFPTWKMKQKFIKEASSSSTKYSFPAVSKLMIPQEPIIQCPTSTSNIVVNDTIMTPRDIVLDTQDSYPNALLSDKIKAKGNI